MSDNEDDANEPRDPARPYSASNSADVQAERFELAMSRFGKCPRKLPTRETAT